jgi:hypothetical protein
MKRGNMLTRSWSGKSALFLMAYLKYLIFDISPKFIPLPSDGFLFDLPEPWDVRALSIRKRAE